jgi:hypothetical protein
VRTHPPGGRAALPSRPRCYQARAGGAVKQRKPAANHHNVSRTSRAIEALLDRRRLAALPRDSRSPHPQIRQKRRSSAVPLRPLRRASGAAECSQHVARYEPPYGLASRGPSRAASISFRPGTRIESAPASPESNVPGQMLEISMAN